MKNNYDILNSLQTDLTCLLQDRAIISNPCLDMALRYVLGQIITVREGLLNKDGMVIEIDAYIQQLEKLAKVSAD